MVLKKEKIEIAKSPIAGSFILLRVGFAQTAQTPQTAQTQIHEPDGCVPICNMIPEHTSNDVLLCI